jgi:tripartite-type tricarboxylate transporter receptor subunit TctC
MCFDPLFEPLTLVGRTPIVLAVQAGSDVTTLEELVANEHRRSGSLSCGSAGTGSASHMTMEVLKAKTKTTFVHVPYRGGGPSIVGFLGGQVQCLFNALTSTVPLLEDRKFRGLAVASGKRVAAIANVPTFGEQGIDLEMYEWFGIVLPVGTPPDVLERLHAELIEFMGTSLSQERLVPQGVELVPQTRAEFRRYIEGEIAKARSVVEAAAIQPN